MAQLVHVSSSTPEIDDRDLEVRILLDSYPDAGSVYFIAAAPPDFRTSFSGSGLPFASSSQAFYNTPNRGTVSASFDREIKLRLRNPGSYYVSHGTVLVPPTVHLIYYVNEQRVTASVQVSHGVPYRSLTYPNLRTGAGFYTNKHQDTVRSQESILRASAYPSINKEAPDFWGGRPPR